MNFEYDIILKSEVDFPKIFSDWEERYYGMLFFNKVDKNSYDSNHAFIYPERINDLDKVLQDIKSFYLYKEITPRIYHPFVDNYLVSNKECFEKNGFEINIFGNNDIMILTEANTITQNQTLDIKLLQLWDERIASDIFIPNEEDYEVEVAKRSMEYEGNYLFAGYLGETAVVTLYLHKTEYNCTRFDYINTARNYRGKGYARQILGYAVDFCKNNKLPCCYQWPANETSRKMCYEAGFRSIFELPNGTATYVG